MKKGQLAEILHLFQAFHYFSLLVTNMTNYTMYVLHPNVHNPKASMVSLLLSLGITILVFLFPAPPLLCPVSTTHCSSNSSCNAVLSLVCIAAAGKESVSTAFSL